MQIDHQKAAIGAGIAALVIAGIGGGLAETGSDKPQALPPCPPAVVGSEPPPGPCQFTTPQAVAALPICPEAIIGVTTPPGPCRFKEVK